MSLSGTIKGLQEAQRWNVRAIAALRPAGALGRAIQWGTTQAHRFAVGFTHVDTGALRLAHRMAISNGIFGGTTGRVFIDPSAPAIERQRTKYGIKIIRRRRVSYAGTRPAVYGPYEHERGGEHAFYRRVVDEHGREISEGMNRMVASEVL